MLLDGVTNSIFTSQQSLRSSFLTYSDSDRTLSVYSVDNSISGMHSVVMDGTIEGITYSLIILIQIFK